MRRSRPARSRRQGRGGRDAPVVARERRVSIDQRGPATKSTTSADATAGIVAGCGRSCSSSSSSLSLVFGAVAALVLVAARSAREPGRDGRGPRRRRLERLAHRRRARRPRRHRLVAGVQRLHAAERQRPTSRPAPTTCSATWACATRCRRSRPVRRIDYVELTVPPGLWLQRDRGIGSTSCPAGAARRSSSTPQNGAQRSKYQPAGQTSLEGLLWPDTYRVADTEDEIDVSATMVAQFEPARGRARPRDGHDARAARRTRSSRSRRSSRPRPRSTRTGR